MIEISILELEEVLGIEESDKIDCPYDCEKCPFGLDAQACEEMYEEYLLEKLENEGD